MKSKLILFCFIILIILVCFISNKVTLINAFYYDTSYENAMVYANSSCGQDDYLKSGNLFIIINDENLHSPDFIGSCLVFNGLDVENFIAKNNIKIISVENLENMIVYNCYHWIFKDYVKTNDGYVNIQIVKSENFVKIGTPLIIDSF